MLPTEMKPMYRSILNSTLYSAVACAALCFCTIPSTLAQEFADQPEDQATHDGGSVTFSVEPRVIGLTYQWMRQLPEGNLDLPDQTFDTLTLTNVSLSDVGLYRCRVMQGNQIEITRAASLYIYTRSEAQLSAKQPLSLQSSSSFSTMSLGDPDVLVLYGPVITTGGSSGTCPGTYAGSVSFNKTVAQGWGWAPSTNTTIHTASDTLRSDTKVTYVGRSFDAGCGQTSIAVPDPTVSLKYRFTIYFPSDVPTTNAYPITLTGFDP